MSARRVEYRLLAELVGDDRNPKTHDVEGIRLSMRNLGVVELPVLDERTGKLVAGHGRVRSLRALRDSGENPPEGVTEDWEIPVLVGWSSASDTQALGYIVESNRLVESGGWDTRARAQIEESLARARDMSWLERFSDSRLDAQVEEALKRLKSWDGSKLRMETRFVIRANIEEQPRIRKFLEGLDLISIEESSIAHTTE